MNIFYLHRCISTQRWARETNQSGIFACGAQTRGVGKEGRPWFSEKGLGLYFSISTWLPPGIDPLSLPIRVARGVQDWLASHFSLRAEIKEPNDLLVKGKKICGILVEKRRNRIIAGVGINLNHRREEFPHYLQERATSVWMETGQRLHPLSVLPGVVEKISAHFPLTGGQG